MNISRRGILTGLCGLICAPAIVRASSLMPVKKIIQIQEFDPIYISMVRRFDPRELAYAVGVQRMEPPRGIIFNLPWVIR